MGRMISRARRRAIIAVSVLAVLLSAVMGKVLLDPDGVGIVGWDPSSVASDEDTITVGDGGKYAYLATQPDSNEPVTYDPCKVIKVVLNERTAPPGRQDLVTAALAEVGDRTRLTFDIVGSSSDEVDPEWQPNTDGDSSDPVLIAWADPAEVPELEGSVAGLGGSAWIESDGKRRYVTGRVLLDGQQLEQLGEGPTRGVILHELAHLVGLAHVASRNELMAPSGSRADWGSGDLAGLEAVGGRCSA